MGTSASYRASSTNYYRAAAALERQAAVYRAQLQTREAALSKKAVDAAARFRAAEESYSQGEIRVSTRILISLIRPAVPNSIRSQARKRLEQIGDEGNKKLHDIDTAFREQSDEVSPGDASYESRWPGLVRDLFEKYRGLTDDYGAVPRTGRAIEQQIARKRRRPEFAAVLNEPQSAALWQLGQEHEEQGHICCAYWVYREASRLLPAKSAQLAQDRLTVLLQDPQLQEAAESCRNLQECHKMYRAAEQVLASNPERARQLLTQIVDQAPLDSELYRAVSQQLETMPR